MDFEASFLWVWVEEGQHPALFLSSLGAGQGLSSTWLWRKVTVPVGNVWILFLIHQGQPFPSEGGFTALRLGLGQEPEPIPCHPCPLCCLSSYFILPHFLHPHPCAFISIGVPQCL